MPMHANRIQMPCLMVSVILIASYVSFKIFLAMEKEHIIAVTTNRSGRICSVLPHAVVSVLDARGWVRERSSARALRPGETFIIKGFEHIPLVATSCRKMGTLFGQRVADRKRCNQV